MRPNYEGYVQVFGEAFGQMVRERIAEHKGTSEPFERGYLLGLHRAVTLMQQTAEQFDIPTNDLGVADIDETEFL
ncbi:MAG TPA: hypothetical protein VFH89_03265 [Sphingomicrobium sp.]|nr:hypothetical protein [Sphingomicrobium sp.]